MQSRHDDSQDEHHIAGEVISEARDSLIKGLLVDLIEYITCCWADLLQEYLSMIVMMMMIVVKMMMIIVLL